MSCSTSLGHPKMPFMVWERCDDFGYPRPWSLGDGINKRGFLFLTNNHANTITIEF